MAINDSTGAHGAVPPLTPASHKLLPAPAQKSRWWIWVLLGVLAVGGFWYYHSKNQATSAAGAPGAAGGKGGAPGAAPTIPVIVAKTQKGDLPVYYNGLGNVTAFNTVTVRSRVDGQIVKINFTEGQFVRQGEALVEIDPRPYQVLLEQAEGQQAKDLAQLHDVQVDLNRYTTLYKEGVTAKQQVDTQQALVGQYEGALKADQGSIDNAKLQIAYSHITAPINGRVGLRLVDVGNIVHASDTTGLLVITQLQPISVLFSLPQDQLQEVMAKMHALKALPVEAFDRDNTTKIATGKLLTIDNQIDTTTGTYKLKAVFDNPNNELFPNQFVNVHLLVDTKKNIVLVPTPAILRGPQGTYVFSVSSDNTVKVRVVTLAETVNNITGVTSGLNPGDVVVTDGQDKLQDGSKVDPKQAPVASSSTRNSSSGNASADANSSGATSSTPSKPANSGAHPDSTNSSNSKGSNAGGRSGSGNSGSGNSGTSR
jgi:membrane fusion protein, multidrug efflux system